MKSPKNYWTILYGCIHSNPLSKLLVLNWNWIIPIYNDWPIISYISFSKRLLITWLPFASGWSCLLQRISTGGVLFWTTGSCRMVYKYLKKYYISDEKMYAEQHTHVTEFGLSTLLTIKMCVFKFTQRPCAASWWWSHDWCDFNKCLKFPDWDIKHNRWGWERMINYLFFGPEGLQKNRIQYQVWNCSFHTCGGSLFLNETGILFFFMVRLYRSRL